MNPTLPARRPDPSEHVEYFGLYINRVGEGNIGSLMEDQISEFRSVLDSIDETNALTIHPPYSWSIKQVVGHLIDVEKVFGYRAHRFATGDEGTIRGMEHLVWVERLDYDSVPLSDLTDELELIRRSNICLVRRLPDTAWDRKGSVDGAEMTVRALTYCLVGHVTHHLDIVRSRIGGG